MSLDSGSGVGGGPSPEHLYDEYIGRGPRSWESNPPGQEEARPRGQGRRGPEERAEGSEEGGGKRHCTWGEEKNAAPNVGDGSGPIPAANGHEVEDAGADASKQKADAVLVDAVGAEVVHAEQQQQRGGSNGEESSPDPEEGRTTPTLLEENADADFSGDGDSFEDDEQLNALDEAQHVANDDAATGKQSGEQPAPQLAQPGGGDCDSSSRSGNVVSISISDEGSIGATLEQMKGNLVVIKAVDPKSNAEKAGLMAGDLPLLLGQRAKYGEFIEACKTRPLVFRVLREIIAIKSGDGEELAQPGEGDGKSSSQPGKEMEEEEDEGKEAERTVELVATAASSANAGAASGEMAVDSWGDAKTGEENSFSGVDTDNDGAAEAPVEAAARLLREAAYEALNDAYTATLAQVQRSHANLSLAEQRSEAAKLVQLTNETLLKAVWKKWKTSTGSNVGFDRWKKSNPISQSQRSNWQTAARRKLGWGIVGKTNTTRSLGDTTAVAEASSTLDSMAEENASLPMPGAAADDLMGENNASIREESASSPVDDSVDGEQGASLGGAQWDFGGVLPQEDIDQVDADRCECVNCDRVACCFWKEVGSSDPNDVWLCCFDCDGGWPDVEELGITHLTEEHRQVIRDRCSGADKPVFPAGLPTRPPQSVKKHNNPAQKKRYDDRRERRATESARKKPKRRQREREEELWRKERESAKRKNRDDEAALEEALEEAARARAEEDALAGLGNDSSLNGSGASSSSSTDDGTNAKGSAPKPASHEGVPLPMQEELQQNVEQAMQQEGTLLRYAKVPMSQWPEWLRKLRDAAPGDKLRRFAMKQPEYRQLQRILGRGRNLVAPDSQTHSLSHICIFVLLNFNSNKRKEAWEDRLLSQNEDGTLVETCLQAVYDFLVDILVVGHGVPRDNAEFLIRECTAFMDRTLETGDYDWCDKDMASYRARVKKTDGPTRNLARKCAEQFYAELYVFSLGEHSYDAVIMGKKQSEGPWFKGMLNVRILQTSKWSHPAVWLKKRNNKQQRDTVVDGGSLVVASAMGANPPQLTTGDRAQIIEAMSRESERRKKINEKKTKAKDRGHCIWVKARCVQTENGNVCGCTIEASLETFDRPAGYRPGTKNKRQIPTHCCPGHNGRGCLGYPDDNGGYKKGKKHTLWKVTKVLEVLKCCKGNEVAKGRLAEFKHDGCICAQCMPADEEADEEPPTKRRRRV